MKFFTYQRDSISYKQYNFFRRKILIPFIIIQILISVSILFFISKVYNTPKEKRLKADIEYLLTEYDNINKRIIHSEALLATVQHHDSIIYQTIFDISGPPQNNLNVYYDTDSVSLYSDMIEATNERLSMLNNEMENQIWTLEKFVQQADIHQEMLLHIPAIQPIQNDDLSRTGSGWGYRIHPIYNTRKFHYGIDFVARTGTSVYATGDGRIMHVISSKSKASKGYGNLIIIDHGFGYKTLYAHLNNFKVKVGDYVTRGQTIGEVGSTGLSTGPHLHYEVIKNGAKVNPIRYFFNDLTNEEYERIVEISKSIKKSYD